MENQVMIGMDLEPDNVQISWFGENLKEPQTVGMQIGVEKFKIPFCLFWSEEEKEFRFGQGALEANQSGSDGTFIPSAFDAAIKGRKYLIDGRNWQGVELLGVFLDRLVRIVENASGIRSIHSIAYTSKTMDAKRIELLRKASAAFEERGTKLYYKTYEESYLAYLFHGQIEFYARDSVLFYFSKGQLDVWHVMVNRKYQPLGVKVQHAQMDGFEAVDEALFCTPEEKRRLDEAFLEMVEKLFGRALVSSVFLTGDGFDKDWMDASLRFLCHGRRVFKGKNLFTKGACYCLMDRLEPTVKYAYRGENFLDQKITVPLWQEGEDRPLTVFDGNGDWYEARARFCCLLEDCEELLVEISDGKGEVRQESLRLTDLPKRPALATKLQVDVYVEEKNRLVIRAVDLGLGEFYRATDRTWEKKVEL